MSGPNTSATGGYLRPAGVLPAYDADLDAILQSVVVGITGLDGVMVRPRWQPNPPAAPDQGVNWCAIGVTRITPQDTPDSRHLGDRDGGLGRTQLRHHEELEVLASFYGPSAHGLATQLRDGLSISQNREYMLSVDMAYVSVEPVVSASDLVNTEWRRRADLPIRLRRRVTREYLIRNVLEAEGTIASADDGASVEPFTTVR